jgi:hypothetical protein
MNWKRWTGMQKGQVAPPSTIAAKPAASPPPAVCPLGEMLTTVLKPLRSIVQRG